MSNVNRRFIALPMMLLVDKKGIRKEIKYNDILTYVTLKSFHNSRHDLCYPSYETLAKKSGMGRNFIIKSLKRLESIGAIEIKRSAKKRKSNQYVFPKHIQFERIPYEIFDIELSANEKSILICFRYIFGSGLMTSFSVNRMAKHLGLSYNTLYPKYKSLKDKGYIEERCMTRDCKGRANYLTKKVNWAYEFYKVEAPKKKCIIKVS